MIITCKFASTCPKCGRPIASGSKCNWERGSKATHVTCPGSAPASSGPYNPPARQTPARRPAPERRPSFPQSPPEPGAIQIQGRRDGRGDRRYDVGQVVHTPKVRESGGGPDGHYFTVIASALFAPNEDNGQYDWTEYAWVRPSTDAEAAPLAAAATAKEAKVSLVAELIEILKAGDRTPESDVRGRPEGREYTIRPGVHGSGVETAVLADDGTVSLWYSGQYDDYRQSLWTTRDPRAVAIMAALISGAVLGVGA